MARQSTSALLLAPLYSDRNLPHFFRCHSSDVFNANLVPAAAEASDDEARAGSLGEVWTTSGKFRKFVSKLARHENVSRRNKFLEIVSAKMNF